MNDHRRPLHKLNPDESRALGLTLLHAQGKPVRLFMPTEELALAVLWNEPGHGPQGAIVKQDGRILDLDTEQPPAWAPQDELYDLDQAVAEPVG